MRRLILLVLLSIHVCAQTQTTGPQELLSQHCFKCHDATQAEGDLDLEGFVAKKPGLASVSTLEDIIVRLQEGDMPPRKAKKQPTDAERTAMMAWAQSQLDAMAEASMDEPGMVIIPRLTRHEYRNILRDLTGGIVLNAGQYLPNEGGAGEGFSNVGAAQGMGVAQFEKYLEAAKGALSHLRVSPHDGLVWSTVPREPVHDSKAAIAEAVNDVINWHVAQQQKWGAEHREALAEMFGNAHAAYLEAAKRGTDTLVCEGKGKTRVSVSLSKVALAKWQRILARPSPDSPFADWAKAWRALPANLTAEKLRAECLAIATGKRGGSTEVNGADFAPPYEISFHEAKEEVIEAASKHGHWPFRIDIGDAKELFLIVTDAGDRGRGEYAVWQRGRFVFKDGSTKPWQDAVQLLGANSGTPFAFGLDGEAEMNLGADAVGVRPPGALKFAVPQDATVFEVDLTLDKNRTKIASIQALVLKEKPKSQSYIPGRYVFGGRKREADANQKGNKERDRLLSRRNVSEANLTKVGLNAERNVLATWTRTPLETIGGPWPDQVADKEEPDAPYHYTAAQVRQNATPEDLRVLQSLEDRLYALTQPSDESKAISWLKQFAERAWSRPLQESEVTTLTQLYRDANKPSISFDSAMKAPLLAVLMSPHFIYPRTQNQEPGTKNKKLASFLWASLPDQELLTADLANPATLRDQVHRMLRDPRARSLATDFAAQVWHFEDFESFTGPDEKRFPEFTAQRRREMLDEVITALNRVFMNDEPLTRLLAEDCLATQPLFLTQTSLPLRTSPVQRGAWVVETLIGRRIPPPPPNVPQISADEKNEAGLNIQQQLAKHRADANCAACHAKIDPPGIALENYDPIGRWRDTERDGSPIVNTDHLADGTEMRGVAGLKKWLLSREDEFTSNFHRKLLGYALGRAVLPGDKRLLEHMKSHKTFSALVIEIVSSPQWNR